MIELLAGLALLTQSDARHYEAPLMITVPAAANPVFWDTPVEVCGHVVSEPDSRGEVTMYGKGYYLIVEGGSDDMLRNGFTACVVGVVRRRDGYSFRGARARGIHMHGTSHGPNPSFLLRRCYDQPSCARLTPSN